MKTKAGKDINKEKEAEIMALEDERINYLYATNGKNREEVEKRYKEALEKIEEKYRSQS